MWSAHLQENILLDEKIINPSSRHQNKVKGFVCPSDPGALSVALCPW